VYGDSIRRPIASTRHGSCVAPFAAADASGRLLSYEAALAEARGLLERCAGAAAA
jgi:hypothetical protein